MPCLVHGHLRMNSKTLVQLGLMTLLLGLPMKLLAISSPDRHSVIYDTVYYDPTDVSQECSGGTDQLSEDTVPQPYNDLFEEAAAKFKTDVALLAAIFWVEHHGIGAKWDPKSWPDHKGPWASSTVGASGPFQFMPDTWGYPPDYTPGYAIDGDKDGDREIQDLTDSAYSAANYLSANGGKVGAEVGNPDLDVPQKPSFSNAIWHYNHDPAYVKTVLEAREGILKGGGASASGSSGTCATGNWIWPIAKKDYLGLSTCWNTSRILNGNKYHHGGLDISAGRGVDALAADGGTIEEVNLDASNGNGIYVVIKHGGKFWSVYKHLLEAKVKKGDQVNQGDVIGAVDSTGTSTGDHLHFNIQDRGGVSGSVEDGGTLNPLDYLPEDGRNLETGNPDLGKCIPGDKGQTGNGIQVINT